MSEPIIVIDHVSMMFNIASEQLNNLKEYFIKIIKRELHFKKFMALEDIDLVINRGEQYGIVGTNGSGKSTLLKIVAGVLEPTKGNVTIQASGMNHITVVSVLGQVVFDTEVNADEYTLNMAQFNKGMYMVRVNTANGMTVKRVTVMQ